MSFETDLEEFQLKTTEKNEDVIRGASFDLFSAIVLDTPVLDGVLRANWFASITFANTMTDQSRQDKTGNATITNIKQKLNAPIVGDIYLNNNLPYARPIEFDGHSANKAPQGMVRVNTVRWPQIVNNVARTLRDR